jgi:DNA-binding IclR family transcriptional regulator
MSRTQNRSVDAAAVGDGKNDRQFVTALARGLEILRCFSARRPELGTTEIAALTGLPQPTVWRLCHTLLKAGYLASARSSDKMRIGVGVLSLGYEAISTVDIGDLAQREMQIVADDFHSAVSLAIPDRLDMVIVKRAQSNSRLVVNLHVGSRLPIGASTTGWAYLAVIPASQRAQLVHRLEAHYGRREWSAKWQKASAAIKSYHKTGYILSGGSYDPEINAIAIPIQPDDGSQFFALTCGAPAAVIPVKTFQLEIAPRLIRVGEIIRAALSHPGSAGSMR